jgi:hypothetical protein
MGSACADQPLRTVAAPLRNRCDPDDYGITISACEFLNYENYRRDRCDVPEHIPRVEQQLTNLQLVLRGGTRKSRDRNCRDGRDGSWALLVQRQGEVH